VPVAPPPEDLDAGLLAGTGPGRLLLSVGLVALLLCVLVWNLPRDTSLRAELLPTVRPLVDVLGLNQRWELFSPDPSTVSVEVTAEVRFADGTERVYRFPDGEPLLGALREYRWRKLERRVRLDDRRALWRTTAAWIAGRYRPEAEAAGTVVTTVTLVRRTSATPTPGSGDRRVHEREAYYTFTVPASGVGSPEAGEER
jgi:hypothetical protein